MASKKVGLLLGDEQDWPRAIELFAEATTVDVQIPERGVVVSGDWGIESGSFAWTLSPVGSGEHFTARGSFVAIWRRDLDGAWKISSDIWNSTDPPS